MITCSNPRAQYYTYQKEILEAIENVLHNGNYILGNEVINFERLFAAYSGVSFAIGVNSGTDALILSLRALDIGHGDEVITVSHTAIATISAIIAVGATPVLVDIDPVYYTMNPEGFRKALTTKTKAVIPVHLYGQSADLDPIISIALENNIYVIEDCAQATGGTYKGKRLGSIGHIGCFSFYPTKNLGAIGDGGMVITNDENIAGRIKRLQQYGWDELRYTKEPGVNSRLDELQAAILTVKLKGLDSDNMRRRIVADNYRKLLSKLPLGLPVERYDSNNVYHLYVVSYKKRDELKKFLAEREVGTGIHYAVPGHLHSGYKERCILPKSGLPETEKIVGEILSLPMYPELTIDETEYIIKSVYQYFDTSYF